MTGGPYDELLRWLSENRCGPWGALKSAAAWLVPNQEYVSRVVDDLSSLGHLEMDWKLERWVVAPPAIVTLPFSGLWAVLAGRRIPPLLNSITDGLAFDDLDIWVDERPQENGPRGIYFSTSQREDLPSLAKRLGIHFSDYPALRLIPALAPYVADAEMSQSPPPKIDGGEVWDAKAMRWRPIDTTKRAGLFRVDAFGRWRHIFSLDGEHFSHSDLRIGRYRELSRVGRHVLRYAAEGVSGTLFVPLGAPLPALHARAATLCTGRLPPEDGEALRYENVPVALAEAVAVSLGQTLQAAAAAARN